MSLKLDVDGLGSGRDSLTGKEGDGVTITLNGKRRFLIWKSLKQVISMELEQVEPPKGIAPATPIAAKATAMPPAVPVNGPVMAK